MQENDFSGTISMYPSTVQPLCTHVDKHVTSNLQICFPAPYLSLHAKYSHMPNMPRGRASPGLPYSVLSLDQTYKKHTFRSLLGNERFPLKVYYLFYFHQFRK